MKISGGGLSVRGEPGGELILQGHFFESIFEQVGYRFVLRDFLNSGPVLFLMLLKNEVLYACGAHRANKE